MHEEPSSGATANPGYAAFQLAKALETAEGHSDAATRERAHSKVRKWVEVLRGMLSGRFVIGSRQPMANVPKWATTEVAMGGFVTGRLLAGGPMLEHERKLLLRTQGPVNESGRSRLNTHYLTEEGLAEITGLLESGCYEINVPEEGALLVVAWLATKGGNQAAQKLLEELTPHFEELRFYPVPSSTPAPSGPHVHLETIGETLQRIRGVKPNRQVLAQREAIQVWAPLHDQMVALFLETVAGETPTLQRDADGRWVSRQTGKFNLAGGWPCRRFDVGWKTRAARLATDCERAISENRACAKPHRETDGFARLHGYLKTCVTDPSQLTGRDVGLIRLILARHVTRHGAPSSNQLLTSRARQVQQAAGATMHEIASVVQGRLVPLPSASLIEDLTNLTQPVTAKEAGEFHVEENTVIPVTLQHKLQRCLHATPEVLVEKGVITSGDTLARVIPQFTAGIAASGFEDPALRQLYAATYRAFRRRRSVLLLNLESQVRLEELPWISATESYRHKNLSTRELVRRALTEISGIAIHSFPHAIIPNKLLQEFHGLAMAADLDLPLVEELAADIFMGSFSQKFVKASLLAGEVMEGSLYAQYFAIDWDEVRRLRDKAPKSATQALVDLCIKRAGVDATDGGVARNGRIIEQAQILTTHNLAPLFHTLGLADVLGGAVETMARHCFEWVCRRQQMKSTSSHASLIMLKNTAYAWRQMIFYLSIMGRERTTEFLPWAGACLAKQTVEFQTRFAPAFRGLVKTHETGSVGASGSDAHGRQFLGWTEKRHWLMN